MKWATIWKRRSKGAFKILFYPLSPAFIILVLITKRIFKFSSSKPSFKIKYNTVKTAQRKKVLHLVPFSVIDAPPEHGSSKDINSLERIVKKDLKLEVDRLYCNRSWRLNQSIFDAKADRRIDFAQYDFFLVNLPGDIKWGLIELLLARKKNQKIYVRSHNAEFFHQIDTAYAWGINLKGVEKLLNAFSCLLSDILSGQLADNVLAISYNDKKKYWEKLSKKSSLIPYVPPMQKSLTIKPTYILSVGSAKGGGMIALEQEMKFYDICKSIRSPKNYQFIQIGAQRPNLAPKNVIAYGFVEDLEDYTSKASVLCVCSGLGWGAKTKITDAIVNGIPVVLPQELYDRVDKLIQDMCFPYFENDISSFEGALRNALELRKTRISKNSSKSNDYHKKLRQYAMRQLKELFV